MQNLRFRFGRSWTCFCREPKPKWMNVLFISENLEEELLRAREKWKKSGAKELLRFPSWMEKAVKSSNGNSLCGIRRWALFECILFNKVKACVFWDCVPTVVHSTGAAQQNDMRTAGGGEFWMEACVAGSEGGGQATGLARSDGRSMSTMACANLRLFIQNVPRREGKHRAPWRRDLEPHSTFWKFGKVMDCFARNNEHQHKTDISYNLLVFIDPLKAHHALPVKVIWFTL